MNRRRTDQPSDLDDLRPAAWCWVTYFIFCAVCAFMATPFGRALLIAIWSQP